MSNQTTRSNEKTQTNSQTKTLTRATETAWRKMLGAFFLVLLSATLAAPLTGCSSNDDDTMGDKIEESVEEAGDAVEEAGDEIEDATDG